MEISNLQVSLGPISVTGTGLYGTGAAVVIVIAIIIWLIRMGPSFVPM
jgi:hypothetical protein